jgi:hypothetical protein
MKNYLFSYTKFVYYGKRGIEKVSPQEKLSAREKKEYLSKLRGIEKGFNKIKRRHVENTIRRLLKKNAENYVKKRILKKLNPYDQKRAEELFAVTYPKENFDKMVNKFKRKIGTMQFSITSENIKNIRFSAKVKFAESVSNRCGVQSTEGPTISLSGNPFDNLKSLINNPPVSPNKIRNTFANIKNLAIQAATKAIKDEMRPQITRNINKIVPAIIEG